RTPRRLARDRQQPPRRARPGSSPTRSGNVISPPNGHSSMKTRIYIVDDHPIVRRGLAGLINAERDMEVVGEADDSSKATAEIMQIRPDLVIVDISLKGNSGLELIKNIKSFDPNIQVVVLSMHDESLYALRVLKAGARAYVMKQDMANKVMEAIRRIRK